MSIDFRPLPNKNVQMLDHFFPLLFPKDSESLKILDIRLREVGAQRPLNGTSKVKKVREKNFLLRGNFSLFSNKNVHIWDHFFPLLFPKDSKSLKILDIRLREVWAKRPLKKTENRRRPKKVKKKTFFYSQQFWTIFKQKCSYLRPLLSITFPQGFRISNNIGHPTSGSGGKKTVKRYLKSEQTHRRTDGQTDTRTDGHFDL